MGNPFNTATFSGSGLPAPSGTKTIFTIVSSVSEVDFQKASDALDRALLREIGLPEEVEIREFENEITDMALQIKAIAKDFTLSKLIALLPGLVMDGAVLYERINPILKNKVSRIDFITRVIRYAYKKNDPDLPYLIEPFETMVEDMILNSVPGLLTNLEKKIAEIVNNIGSFLR